MAVRLLQLENADFPIFVTPSGIVILVKLLQLENAESPILVTLFPSITAGNSMSVEIEMFQRN